MRVTTRRKISYVVKSDNEEQAHCLGVNSLAIDAGNEHSTHGGILYSAGRDGIVASWDLHLNLKREVEEDKEKWIVDTSMQIPRTSCKAFSQMHTDWVNDIVLCNGGTHVVSASSDRTIKVWKPYSDTPKTAHTVGWHTDYAKCLTYASGQGWVASGGLDRKIKIWDLNQSEAILSINAGPVNLSTDGSNDTVLHDTSSKCSIYALAVNPTGTLLASGSPEKVVRLWDPKSGKRVGKLTGHTDNIRALLMSDDGQYILSGSSDSTIKLWSVKAQRCLTTYETHPDSVWSLYSEHPELKTFYSGSRDGLVNKTEITGHTLAEGDSECIGLFKEDSGVAKIVALDDTFVWTATSSSSINRWKSVPSLESRQILPRSEFNPEIPNSALIKLPPAKSAYSSQIPESYVASDQLTMYAGSVLSIPISYQDEEVDNESNLIPLRSEPDDTLHGKPGIISHLVLHNRRHILTKDTNGEISMWDLIKCSLVKNFGKRDLEDVAQEVNGIESFPAWCSVDTKIGAITVQLHESHCFDCEMYADEVDLPPAYTYREDQRLNLGKWVLTHLFDRFVKKELEYEKEGHIRFGGDDSSNKADSLKSRSVQTPYEERGTPEQVVPPVAPPSNTTNNINNIPPPIDTEGPKIPLAAVTANTDVESPFAPHHPPQASVPLNGPFTAPPASSSQSDYFSGNHHGGQQQTVPSIQIPPQVALPTSPTSPTGASTSSSFMNRIKNPFSKTKLGRVPTSEDRLLSPTSETLAPTTTTLSKQPSMESQPEETTKEEEKATEETVVEENSSKPIPYSPPNLDDFPPLDIPPSTMIIIAEESAETSTGIDVYRGTVDTVGEEATTIIEKAPTWLLTYLLYNKTPPKETVKLTFVLRPAEGSSLGELPGGPNNRLLANRVLRVRKLIQYVAEKLEMEDVKIELLCGDTLLTPTMTLGTVKRHILKSSGDIPLSYRLKEEQDK